MAYMHPAQYLKPYLQPPLQGATARLLPTLLSNKRQKEQLAQSEKQMGYMEPYYRSQTLKAIQGLEPEQTITIPGMGEIPISKANEAMTVKKYQDIQNLIGERRKAQEAALSLQGAQPAAEGVQGQPPSHLMANPLTAMPYPQITAQAPPIAKQSMQPKRTVKDINEEIRLLQGKALPKTLEQIKAEAKAGAEGTAAAKTVPPPSKEILNRNGIVTLHYYLPDSPQAVAGWVDTGIQTGLPPKTLEQIQEEAAAGKRGTESVPGAMTAQQQRTEINKLLKWSEDIAESRMKVGQTSVVDQLAFLLAKQRGLSMQLGQPLDDQQKEALMKQYDLNINWINRQLEQLGYKAPKSESEKPIGETAGSYIKRKLKK